jgi:histidinol-phosphate aminotransferase
MEDDIYSFARERGISERKAVDVSSGICPCGPSGKVRAAIRKAIRDIRFPPEPSLSRLRRTVSSKLGAAGNNVFFANSVEELLRLISGVFRPQKVTALGPVLDVHSSALTSSGSEIEYASWGEGGETGSGGLVFVSQPNRISGRLVDLDRMDRMFDSGGHDNLVVVDESLIEFTGDPGSCERAFREERVIVLRSTANFYGLPGLGVAYAISSPGIIGRLKEKKSCEVNTLAAAAARAALIDKTYRETARKYVAEERKLLCRSIERIGGFRCFDSDSNVFLIQASCPAEEISSILARKGFLIRPWKTGDAPGGVFLRMSVMEHEKNVKFLRVLKQAAGVERTSGGSCQ